MHPDYTQLVTGVQVWSLSRVKAEFWKGYLKSKVSPSLSKNWDSKSWVYASRFHPVGDWSLTVEFKSSVKVEFWKGYLNSKFLPWLGKSWESKSWV